MHEKIDRTFCDSIIAMLLILLASSLELLLDQGVLVMARSPQTGHQAQSQPMGQAWNRRLAGNLNALRELDDGVERWREFQGLELNVAVRILFHSCAGLALE